MTGKLCCKTYANKGLKNVIEFKEWFIGNYQVHGKNLKKFRKQIN
jgi:hypothetical protein